MRCFFFSSRRRHTRCGRDWSSDVCSSDLVGSSGTSAGSGQWDEREHGDEEGWTIGHGSAPSFGVSPVEREAYRPCSPRGCVRGGDERLCAPAFPRMATLRANAYIWLARSLFLTQIWKIVARPPPRRPCRRALGGPTSPQAVLCPWRIGSIRPARRWRYSPKWPVAAGSGGGRSAAERMAGSGGGRCAG